MDLNGDGATDLLDVKLLLETNKNCVTYLDGDGDFRSPECVAALKEADVVVTNPPFSLFREYVAQLVEYDKKFLIIGNINCITYKEIFPLIMQNKIWLGYGMGRAIAGFYVPDTYELYGTEAHIDNKGRRIVATNQCLWLTNIDIQKRHEDIILFKRYSEEPELFPRYDNYDAIEVSKTAFIPADYYGVMGVPITFLDKYNPDQFEIIGNSQMFAEAVVVDGKLSQLLEGHSLVAHELSMPYRLRLREGPTQDSAAVLEVVRPHDAAFLEREQRAASHACQLHNLFGCEPWPRLAPVYGRAFCHAGPLSRSALSSCNRPACVV